MALATTDIQDIQTGERGSTQKRKRLRDAEMYQFIDEMYLSGK